MLQGGWGGRRGRGRSVNNRMGEIWIVVKKEGYSVKTRSGEEKETLGGFKYESSVLSIIDRTDEEETHNTQKIIAEIRERSESGTFTRSNNLLLQPIDPNTNAAATNY